MNLGTEDAFIAAAALGPALDGEVEVELMARGAEGPRARVLRITATPRGGELRLASAEDGAELIVARVFGSRGEPRAEEDATLWREELVDTFPED